MGKYWHRPKLTETQLGGEDNRLIPRGLLPEQVRADLIRALASMEGTNTVTAACHELGIALEMDSTTIANCLAGRQPIYGSILSALYGPGNGNSLPTAWTNPADFGPLKDHAIAAGLFTVQIESTPGVDTPELTNSPDPGAGAPNPTVAAPAPEIVAPVTTPRPSDELPAAPAPKSDAVTDAAPGGAASPAFSSKPDSLRAPDAASPSMGHRSAEPVQLREVPAASEGPPPAPTPPDPLAVAESLLAGRLAAALEELAVRQRRFEEADLRAQALRTAVAELRAARADVAQDRAAA